MKTHVAKKYSGIEAIGDIPFHWKIEPLKYNIGINRTSLTDSTPKDTPILYVDIESVLQDGTIKDPEALTFGDAPSRARRVIGPNDTIISMVRTYLESIAYFPNPPNNLICSTGFAVLTAYSKLTSKFLYYWIRSIFFIGEVVSRSIGVGYPALNSSEIGRLPCLLPPLEEQNSIVQLLDMKIKQITEHISKRRKLIELLKENRQSLIDQTVTKGLDPNILLKDPGSKFYSQIPEHWTLVSLGNLCNNVADGPHYSPRYVEKENGILFLSARNVKVDRWLVDDVKYISEKDYLEFCKRVKPEIDDILYTKGGTTGVARVVDFRQPFHVWVHVAVLKIKKELIDPYFLAFVLNSTNCYQQSQLYTRGASNNDLGLTRLVKISLALPSISEQKIIVQFLKHKITIIDRLLSKIQLQIEKLQEYSQTLISAAVTGQIDLKQEISVQ